jgi:hypothetical protein
MVAGVDPAFALRMLISVVAPSAVVVPTAVPAAVVEFTVSAEVIVSTAPPAMVVPVAVPVPAAEAVASDAIIVIVVAEMGADIVITPIKLRVRVVEAVPRTGADEYTIHEPLRAPIAIGRAAERIVRIVPVGAHRGRVIKPVVRTDMHSDRNLCVRVSCRHGYNRQQD